MSELYELPDGWEWKTLSDCVTQPKKDIVDGPFGSNLKATEYINSGIPIIRLQNIQRFQFIDKDIKFVSEKKGEQLKRHTFKSGDIVITKLGAPLGKSCIVPAYLKKGVIVADVIRVRVNEEKTNKSYLEYVLNSQVSINQFSNSSKGATRQRVKLTMVRDLEIPFPPLPEQKRIVSKLDTLFEKIDKAIALHQKNMNEADAFMGSVLNDVFGELESKHGLTVLSNVVKINSGIALPKIFKDKENTDGELEFFKVAQMNNDMRVMKGANLNFTLSQSKEFKIKLFPKGSILIPKRGGAILTNKKRIMEKEASYDSNVMGLKADNKILLDEFLFIFLNSIDLSNYIDTATIPQVNNKHIDMMNISIPPLNVQEKIVTYIDEISQKIEKIKSVQKEKMESLVALKASILDQAFRGEL